MSWLSFLAGVLVGLVVWVVFRHGLPHNGFEPALEDYGDVMFDERPLELFERLT